ncbi:MAG: YabP/YqfC family sporulation protein [Clostridia bacterium]|nr:YabP/YqfC family sporulation protein [Clostridia bacterium]
MPKSDFQQFNTSFSHRICDTLDITDDICRKCGYIEIISNYCALIDGCRSIMEYDDSVVKLNLGKSAVTIRGNNLSIKSLSMEQAMVEGFILCIEFSN